MSALRNKLIEIQADVAAAIALLEPEPYVGPANLLVWGSKVSQDFRESVHWIESKIGLKANFLMACMAFETGLTFSPSVKNPASSATGLIQFMRTTALDLGTTVEDLAKMTAVRQLSYVYRYFERFAKSGQDLSKWDLADTYMAILLPSMIGTDLDTPMKWSDKAYFVNKGLDANKDGKVTKREAYVKIKTLYDLGSKPENMA